LARPASPYEPSSKWYAPCYFQSNAVVRLPGALLKAGLSGALRRLESGLDYPMVNLNFDGGVSPDSFEESSGYSMQRGLIRGKNQPSDLPRQR
jgi:hypothetical protein